MPADSSTGRNLNRSREFIARRSATSLRLAPAPVLPVLFCLAALAAVLHSAQAQTLPPPNADYVYEVQTRARWLHGRQQARFTRFNERTDWIHVDSLDASATGLRTMELLLGASSGDSARVRFDAQGRVVDTDVMLRALPERVLLRPGEREHLLRHRLFSGGGESALPRDAHTCARAALSRRDTVGGHAVDGHPRCRRRARRHSPGRTMDGWIVAVTRAVT